MSVLLPEHREREVFSDWEQVGGVWLPPRLIPPRPPTAVGLFEGAGGFACGFHQAGWHVIAGSEWWPVAVMTYLCNLGSPDTMVYVGETAAPDATKKERGIFEQAGGEFVTATEFFGLYPRGKIDGPDMAPGGSPYAESIEYPCEVFFCCDVRELTGEFVLDTLGLEQGDVGCVMGGPPCQGFSVAGNRDPGDGRSQLVFEFARVVCEIQPQAFVMENVPGILSMVTPEGLPVLDALALAFESGGMGEYDALRRSLLSTAGVGAAVKGAKKTGRANHVADVDDELELADEQLTLDAPAADIPAAMETV